MIQDMLMTEIIKKAYSLPLVNSKTCYLHKHPLVYPIEYDECPGCGNERVTRVILGVD